MCHARIHTAPKGPDFGEVYLSPVTVAVTTLGMAVTYVTDCALTTLFNVLAGSDCVSKRYATQNHATTEGRDTAPNGAVGTTRRRAHVVRDIPIPNRAQVRHLRQNFAASGCASGTQLFRHPVGDLSVLVFAWRVTVVSARGLRRIVLKGCRLPVGCTRVLAPCK